MRLVHPVCFALFMVTSSAGCVAEIGVEGEEDDPYDPADEEEPPLETLEAVALPGPIRQRAGAWWGDTRTPEVNQLWGELLNSTPGKNLTGPITYQWTCSLPKFTGSTQTLRLTSTSFSVDSSVQKSFSNPTAGTVYSYTLDPSKYTARWVELRVRCKAAETVGPETGEVTAITIGWPVQIRGGTSVGSHHGTDYVDTHGWYDRGVDYVYAAFLELSRLVAAPLKGTVSVRLKARVSGATYLDHFMLKIDGQIATLADGRKAEFLGSTTTDRTLSIDTTKLSNGPHVFAMHSHGLEKSTSEMPGKQLAAQSEITVNVQN